MKGIFRTREFTGRKNDNLVIIDNALSFHLAGLPSNTRHRMVHIRSLDVDIHMRVHIIVKANLA